MQRPKYGGLCLTLRRIIKFTGSLGYKGETLFQKKQSRRGRSPIAENILWYLLFKASDKVVNTSGFCMSGILLGIASEGPKRLSGTGVGRWLREARAARRVSSQG